MEPDFIDLVGKLMTAKTGRGVIMDLSMSMSSNERPRTIYYRYSEWLHGKDELYMAREVLLNMKILATVSDSKRRCP